MKSPFGIQLLIALLLFFFPCGAGAMSDADKAPEVFHPTITEIKGEVAVKGLNNNRWEEARQGMLLLSGDTLRTNKGGFARIDFAGGVMEIYETTVVVIPSVDLQDRRKDLQEVIIEEGRTLFDINPRGVERGFKFRTKNIQGGVKGTLFTVSYLENGTSVNVYRGLVGLRSREGSDEGPEVFLKAGNSVRVRSKVDLNEIKGFDPSSALEEYRNNIPPGLDAKGLPADHNADPDNRGVRDRGEGLGRKSPPGQVTKDADSSLDAEQK